MQMSQDGLLRSLLLQIIEQQLRQETCDILKEKLVAFVMMQSSLPTIQFKDLLQLFRLVIEDAGNSTKFFLILDGLDEFDGDKTKLISLIHTLGKYEYVKLCVSSRPWTVFEDGFRQQPSLILQHLTHRDILLYTRERLAKEPAFHEMSWADPSNASSLVRNITEKASGVFLWVVLTVDSLIKGLTDGDRVQRSTGATRRYSRGAGRPFQEDTAWFRREILSRRRPTVSDPSCNKLAGIWRAG